MSKVKKVFAIILSMAMILGMSLTTFAVPTEVTDITSKIRVEGLSADVDTTVNMYKFATLQYNADNNEYSWLIADWADDYVKLNDKKTAYEITSESALKDAAEKQTSASYTATSKETFVEFLNVPIGGYVIIPADNNADYDPLFVTNTYDRDASPDGNGKPVAIDVTAYAKSEGRTITKEQEDDFAQIGQTVDYKIKATFPMSEDEEGSPLTSFVITDTPTGLKINVNTVKVELAGVDITAQITKAVAQDTGILTVNFANLINGKHDGKAIEITYEAVVTDTVYNNNASAQSNTTTYEPGSTEGTTGDIELTKRDIDSKVALSGAEFKVYDLGVDGIWNPQGSNTAMNLIFDDELDAYRPVLEGENAVSSVVVDENGVLKIVGLDEGTYHFEETKAPSGYSINNLGLDVVVTKDDASKEVDFNDTKLSSLPSTGGIGTTIFTIGGCAIMIAAAGLYFASRRKQESK